MTEIDIGRLFTWLKAQYPGSVVTAATVKAWAHALRNVELRDAKVAIETHILRSKFFPSVAEVLDILTERAAGLEPAETAWLEVERAVHRWGRHREWSFENPALDLAVELVGKEAICNSEDMVGIRAHFMRAYTGFRVQELQAARAAVVAGVPFVSVLNGRRRLNKALPARVEQRELAEPEHVREALRRALPAPEEEP